MRKKLDYKDIKIIDIFEKDFKVGFVDLTKMLDIKNTALIKYAQEVAMEHVEEEHFGYLELLEKGFSWILSSWKVEVINRPKYGTKFKIRSWRHDCTAIRAYRDFEIICDDKIVAKITSLWLLLDLETRKLVSIDKDSLEKFTRVQKRLFENYDFEKLECPLSFDDKMKYKIRKRDLDLNGHVNNEIYLELAYEIIPSNLYETCDFSKFEIEYKKELRANDEISICYKKMGSSNIVVFFNEDETQIHAIVKLEK